MHLWDETGRAEEKKKNVRKVSNTFPVSSPGASTVFSASSNCAYSKSYPEIDVHANAIYAWGPGYSATPSGWWFLK